MPLYQITTIVRATSSTAEVRSLLMRITQLVLDGKGVLAGVSHWGLQPLAYRMKCHQEFHRDGRFLQMKFIMSPQTLAEVDRNMRIDERVLRFLVLKERNTSLMAMGGFTPETIVAALKSTKTLSPKTTLPPISPLGPGSLEPGVGRQRAFKPTSSRPPGPGFVDAARFKQ